MPDEPRADQPPTMPRAPRKPANPLSTAGLIVALVAVLLCFGPVLGIIPGVTAIVLSGVGLWVGTRTDVGVGQALGGLGIGFVALAYSAIALGENHTYVSMALQR